MTFMDRVMRLRVALGLYEHGLPAPYNPHRDSLIRRVAERLPPELVDDVAELIKLARGDL